MLKVNFKSKRFREFYHYVVGTLLIIFLGHFITDITGLEKLAIAEGLWGVGGFYLFLFYLTWYILIDQALHWLFDLD